MKVKNINKILRVIILALLILITSVLSIQYEENDIVKKKVEEAGCPFVGRKQLLERTVCLMPHYALNEMPKNTENDVTLVNIYLLHVYILEVDEGKNQITIEVLQYMDWKEPRIRANFSTTHGKNKIKLSSKNVNMIWHPELDIYTKRLKESQSLYDPFVYHSVYISKRENETIVKLSALKAWRATVSCNFDMTTFPFDSQNCSFLEFGSSAQLVLKTNCQPEPEILENKPAGFKVTLTRGGTYCDGNTVWMDIGFNLTLERIIQPYLYQYYFPTIAIVIVSQISFLIPLTALPGRVALVVTQFLTLSNIFIHEMVRIIT